MSKIKQHVFYNKKFKSINTGNVYKISLENLYNADIIYFNSLHISDNIFSLTILAEKNNCIFSTFLLGLVYNNDCLGFIYFNNDNYKKLIKKIYRKIKRHSKNYKLKYKINTVSITMYKFIHH